MKSCGIKQLSTGTRGQARKFVHNLILHRGEIVPARTITSITTEYYEGYKKFDGNHQKVIVSFMESVLAFLL